MEYFFHHLNLERRKIRLERLHFKILKRKYDAVFKKLYLNNDIYEYILECLEKKIFLNK